ncbi:MAG: hypothetical protein HC851_15140 [Acaryochloris sp. RU_4_1]|nr:hypothetical protein [Acaryochloris sp. RU_4_1]NJR56049.1 hypothetical protein [Acaryochloris sp. CRU_2_0]
MKLITSITFKQADHTQVIDTAAIQIGRAANKAFLFVVEKEIQGWKNLMVLCSWWLSKVGRKHGSIFQEVKGSAIALYRHGCKKETAFFQELIKAQITAKVDAHWELHDKAIKWFKAQTQAFLADKPAKNTSEAKSEDQTSDISEEVEKAPVTEVTPISEEDEPPVQVLDPPVEDAEMAIPEDPAPVLAKRRGTRKTVADLIKEEAGKAS